MRKIIFSAVIGLIVITASPYGTVEPWWKAAFVCAVFAICIVAIIDALISGNDRINGASILLPMLALSVLAFLQSATTISADPFQTRFFALQMLALTTFLALLYRYGATEQRVRILVYTVLAIAVASAIFGILRQTTQHQTGFVLPLLKPNQGYGQFINKNHFAYLMEMAFGLGLGIIITGDIAKDRLMIYVALLLPIWTALVLANSRGGVLAMLAEIILATLLLLSVRADVPRSRSLRAALLSILIIGVLVGTLWVGGDRLAGNLAATTTELSTESTREGASRNEIWRASAKMFAAHPILGAGLGGYWIGITAYHEASGVMTPQEAHNDYLELLSSGGLIGLAIGVWFGVMVIREARKNLFLETGFLHAARVGAVLGIAGVAAHSLVDFGLHMIANAVVFLTLIMIVTTKISSDKSVDLNTKAP
ncbi:MAG TPA: O-antigen ligase family protein [Pyrinomonadaceae bacterium]|nr:O-antigen ligase family protein [Pyrinomonadaceae bacterium]